MCDFFRQFLTINDIFQWQTKIFFPAYHFPKHVACSQARNFSTLSDSDNRIAAISLRLFPNYEHGVISKPALLMRLFPPRSINIIFITVTFALLYFIIISFIAIIIKYICSFRSVHLHWERVSPWGVPQDLRRGPSIRLILQSSRSDKKHPYRID